MGDAAEVVEDAADDGRKLCCGLDGRWSDRLAIGYFADTYRPLRDRERRGRAFRDIGLLADWIQEAGAIGAAVHEFARAQELLELALEEARRPLDASEKFKLLTVGEVLKLPPVSWVVDGWLTDRGLGGIVGPSNSGKSLVTLDIALSVATEMPFRGEFTVKGGSVVYIAAEDAAGQKQRLGALLDYRSLRADDVPRLRQLHASPMLRKPGDVSALLQAIDKLPEPPRMILFDTMRETLNGSDSKDEDVGEYIASVRRIMRETGAAAEIVHHFGHATERERGSSVLRGAVDTLLFVTRDDLIVTLHQEKQRNAATLPDVLFEIIAWGDSAVLRPITQADRKDRPAEVPPTRQKALEALRQCDEGGGASFSKWHETSGLTKSTFARAVADLSQWSLIRRNGRKYEVVSEVG